MIVAKNVVQDENPHKRIMIPYKSVYGAPRKCKLTSDHKTTEEKYRKCQINAIDKWKITLQHYVSTVFDNYSSSSNHNVFMFFVFVFLFQTHSTPKVGISAVSYMMF